MCDTDPGEQCIVNEELNSVHCFCDTDNCNAGLCGCNPDCYCEETPTVSTSTSTVNPDNGLKCQVCQLEDHMCDGESDNGKSMTCLEGEVCVKLEEGMNYKQKQSIFID